MADRAVASATALLVSVLLGACGGGDGRELRPATAPAPAPTTTTTTPAGTSLATLPGEPLEATVLPPVGSGPVATATGADEIVFDQLWSPEPGVAQVIGSGASLSDSVTVDDEAADIISFDIALDSGDGRFDARIFVAEEGAHTVCVESVCGRVYTLAPDAETPEEVVAKIDEARMLANEVAPVEAWFPEWTFEVGGALAGTGGTSDDERRVVTVYRNRGRTVDDFVRTILHEYGHVADVELLTDELRLEFAALRGYPAGSPWRIERSHRLDDWAASPAEDFAEAMATVWSDGRWGIRTDGGPLTDDQRRFLQQLTPPAG